MRAMVGRDGRGARRSPSAWALPAKCPPETSSRPGSVPCEEKRRERRPPRGRAPLAAAGGTRGAGGLATDRDLHWLGRAGQEREPGLLAHPSAERVDRPAVGAGEPVLLA